jgi:hypothetical protein
MGNRNFPVSHTKLQNIMFGLFKKDPLVNLQKSYNQLLEEAMQLQRKGDIKGYAAKMAESELVMNEIEKIKKG